MKKKNFKNILVVSLSNIGDVILTLPVANVLKGNFPDADLSLVIGPKADCLFYPTDYFKEIIIYDKKGSLQTQFSFLKKLWQRKFDLVIDLRNTLIPFLIFAQTFNSPFKKNKTKIQMKQKHLKALDFLDLNQNLQTPFSLFSEEHKNSLEEKLKEEGLSLNNAKQAIAIAPGARHWLKTWPVESFAGLCRRIHEKNPNQLFFLTGSKEESEATGKLTQAFPGKVVDFAGKLSISEFACLLAHIKLLVSNDSAAMHIANYEKVPVVAIFGPTDPEKYGEVSDIAKIVYHESLSCRPCEKATCPTNRECLNELPIETILQNVLTLQKA